MNAWTKFAIVALAALLATDILVRRAQPRGGAGEGQVAPSLALPTPEGANLDLRSLKGRVVAVNFWATWCPPCRYEIPELAAFWRENRDRCFDMLGVAEDSGSGPDVAAAARAFGIPYPVLVDERGGAAARWGVPGFPKTFIVDAEGRVRRTFEGAVRKQELDETVRPLLPKSCSKS